MRGSSAIVVAVLLLAVVARGAAAQDGTGFAAECHAPTGAPEVTVGAVDCQRMESAHVGGVTVFSYYVPDGCTELSPCPVVYFLHGTGGTYRQGTGAVGSPGPWIRALTSGPPVDPRTIDEPWTLSDPSTWVPKPALDLILVSPHGLTVPGGHGPTSGVDTGWADWNPKYAAGGEWQRYDTPPPRVESHLFEELVPYVDAHFPTVADRTWRAITGKSQGGFGSFANGFHHPDVWSVQAMLSGGGFPFPALEAEGQDFPDVAQIAMPIEAPYVDLPGPLPLVVPEAIWSAPLVAEVSVGFGDPAADNVWWRSINPIDLSANARAWAGDGTQSTFLKYHVNDAVPRRIPDDFLDPQAYAANQAFETLLYPMDLYMERVFDFHEVETVFHVGPGLHNNDPYQQPYFREHLEAYAANLAPVRALPWPDRFDYRTHKTSFSIWGWTFDVEREPVEFLFLTDVTCAGLTLRGSGVVHVTPPGSCGKAPATVELGASFPTNEPAGAGAADGWNHTATVDLDDAP